MLDEMQAVRWAEANFGKADLGHAARNTRARLFAAAMARAPAVSIPRMVDEPLLGQYLAKLLDKDKARRFGSAAELKSAILAMTR